MPTQLTSQQNPFSVVRQVQCSVDSGKRGVLSPGGAGKGLVWNEVVSEPGFEG